MTEESVPAVPTTSHEPQPPVDAVGLPDSGGPRTSRTRAITTVMLGLTAVGLLVGGLWAWVAPAVHAVVAVTRTGERVHDYLGSESENFFVAPFLMLGLLGVVAVVAAVLIWQWREHRGPAMVAAFAAGLVGAAAAATAVGALLVYWRYGALDFDTVPLASGDHSLTYVIEAPPVFFARHASLVAATLLLPAAVGSLVYALMAAGTVRDDLGGYPPVEPRPAAPAKAPEAPVS